VKFADRSPVFVRGPEPTVSEDGFELLPLVWVGNTSFEVVEAKHAANLRCRLGLHLFALTEPLPDDPHQRDRIHAQKPELPAALGHVRTHAGG